MRKIQKELKEKFKEISDAHGVELEELLNIESSIWKSTAEAMASGDRENFKSFENIYIYGLGTFYASEGKWKKINKK